MATYENLPNFNGLQVGDIVEYTYSGEVFPVVFRKATYKITVYGAQGGWINSSTNGGQGGSAEGTWKNNANGRIAFIRVGGSGNNGGFNGGGERTTIDGYPGGGGASDVRLDLDSLYNRLIVGGGGGSSGDASNNRAGGAGGSGVVIVRYATTSPSGAIIKTIPIPNQSTYGDDFVIRVDEV